MTYIDKIVGKLWLDRTILYATMSQLPALVITDCKDLVESLKSLKIVKDRSVMMELASIKNQIYQHNTVQEVRLVPWAYQMRGSDKIFVKKFTPPDFREKIYTFNITKFHQFW